jgi:hypothetical protein
MRDKDAIEAERLKLEKAIEKQNIVVERLVGTEKNLLAQLVNHTLIVHLGFSHNFGQSTLEKELSTLKNTSNVYKDKAETLAQELREWVIRADGEKQKAHEVSKLGPEYRILMIDSVERCAGLPLRLIKRML